MIYRTVDLKLDQFIHYLNDGKINLIPPFQRGHVWNKSTRVKLIENVIQGKPIPAIFLYREESGEKYAYNILDGKQRLESLMLFVGNRRPSLGVANLLSYFYDRKVKDLANFKVNVDGDKLGLSELDEAKFRDFREYVIPTIEITLSGEVEAPLDEMIDLFVDINQYGEKVKRFDIVKAMTKDALLRDAFALVAVKQKRGKDYFYKAVQNEITYVLKRLQIVDNLQSPNAKVDRMWELIVEIMLFVKDSKHRTPVAILKSFIKAGHTASNENRLSKADNSVLRQTFRFLREAYKNESLVKSRLATNQIHFYSMVTAVIGNRLLSKYSEADLIAKLETLGAIIDGDKRASGKLAAVVKEYQALSAKHTTHPGKRLERQTQFTNAIEMI